MTSAALKAARGLVRDFGEVEQLQVSIKGPGEFVSTADLKAERTLRNELHRARPGYGLLFEEGGEVEGTDPRHRWIVDPLDGTTNFLHGIPHFAIEIAKCGMPCRKLVVPSSGSTIQRWRGSVPSTSPPSSNRRP